MYGAPGGQGHPESKGCVLLVNNLSPLPEKVSCDVLFTLFGVYGDVIRVKILYNKRDTAMVQYATPHQAYLGQKHLNRLFLFDKELAISFSRHSEVSLPRAEDFESAMLTKDYTGSPIHRFKHRTVRATKNINPPSQVLHVSNIPDGTIDTTLRTLFGEEATEQPSIRFFSTNRTMAFVKMANVHDAVLALIRLHNFKLGN